MTARLCASHNLISLDLFIKLTIRHPINVFVSDSDTLLV